MNILFVPCVFSLSNFLLNRANCMVSKDLVMGVEIIWNVVGALLSITLVYMHERKLLLVFTFANM